MVATSGGSHREKRAPAASVLFWRRTDVEGLERLELRVTPDGIDADSSVICVEDGGFRLEHRWRLAPDWHAHSLEVDRWDADGHRRLTLARARGGWTVDGEVRPDLDGAEEPDLSVTPFCNTFPIRRTPKRNGGSLALDTCYVDAAAMTVARSSQRYEWLGPGRVRYVDLGVAAGFRADLDVDDDGLVLRYEHLFERVVPRDG